MIVSRSLAKRRIAAGERPGWIAAWGPVAVDFVAVSVYALVAYALLVAWIVPTQPPGWLVYALAFALIFLPLQMVLVVSALWAVKSRWVGEDDRNPS